MKRTALGIACLALIAVTSAPGFAWEIEMTGSMNWLYEYYSQRGTNGFFGPYNVDLDGTSNTSNLNFWWNGPRVAQNLVTGADASRSYLYVLLDPTIKINPALKLRSRIRIGQWNNPQASYYNTVDSPGTDNATTRETPSTNCVGDETPVYVRSGTTALAIMPILLVTQTL